MREIVENVQFAPGVHEAFALLRSNQIKTAIISITFDFAVKQIAQLLHCDYYVGTSYDTNGKINYFWPEDKGIWLNGLCGELKISRSNTAAVGDSWGDLYMLEQAGYAYYVGEHVPTELGYANHYPNGRIDEIVEHMMEMNTRGANI